MNIEDLLQDIEEMEDNDPLLGSGVSKNEKEYLDMLDIAYEYDNNREKCQELIDEFRTNFGRKINII